MFCFEKTQWFAMRVTYRRELDVKNLLAPQGVSSFNPILYVIIKAKKIKMREMIKVVHIIIYIQKKYYLQSKHRLAINLQYQNSIILKLTIV